MFSSRVDSARTLTTSRSYTTSGSATGDEESIRGNAKRVFKIGYEFGDVWPLFPAAFTLLNVVLFFIPIWILTTYIGRDMNAEIFLGETSIRPLLCLPVLYCVVHVLHVIMGRPSRALVALPLFLSTLLMLCISDELSRSTHGNAVALLNPNCQSFQAKADLEVQWENARKFYATCLSATANKTNTSFQEDMSKYRINDCGGYQVGLATNPSWPYLQALEEKQNCGGWCAKAQPLWTKQPVKESCSLAVAQIMQNKLNRAARQTESYCFLLLIFILIGFYIGNEVVLTWCRV